MSPYYTLLLLLTNLYFCQKKNSVTIKTCLQGIWRLVGRQTAHQFYWCVVTAKTISSQVPKWHAHYSLSVSLNSSFLQRHLEPAKAAAERLSLPNISPLHCLSGIWHFRDTGLPSYLNRKYGNGSTQQSERRSCDLCSLKAFLQCSKASPLIESLS